MPRGLACNTHPSTKPAEIRFPACYSSDARATHVPDQGCLVYQFLLISGNSRDQSFLSTSFGATYESVHSRRYPKFFASALFCNGLSPRPQSKSAGLKRAYVDGQDEQCQTYTEVLPLVLYISCLYLVRAPKVMTTTGVRTTLQQPLTAIAVCPRTLTKLSARDPEYELTDLRPDCSLLLHFEKRVESFLLVFAALLLHCSAFTLLLWPRNGLGKYLELMLHSWLLVSAAHKS
jgi:hypothetical protein